VTIPCPQFCRMAKAASVVGVEPHVLRYWEEVFGMQVERSKSGQRVYSAAQVADLLAIKHLVRDLGYTVPGARRALALARRNPTSQKSTPDSISSVADSEYSAK
jgi:DNA-binding transcriptional MerR regulator